MRSLDRIKELIGFLKIAVVAVMAIICLCACAPENPAEWHMVNVNANGPQGDAHLLIDNGVVSLIDTGQIAQTRSNLIPYLKKLGISEIDHLWISHPHTDHYGGIDAVLSAQIKILNIYFNKPPQGHFDFDFKPAEFFATLDRAKKSGASIIDVQVGFTLSMPSTTMSVLFAPKSLRVEGRSFGTNDLSLVMGWDAGGYTTLFTGDLDFNSGDILSREAFVEADILKIPHHGVTGMPPNTFFDKVNPSILMFPQPKVLRLHRRGQQVNNWIKNNQARGFIDCRNGVNGTVSLTFTAKGIDVSPERSSQVCPRKTIEIEGSREPFFDRMNRFDLNEPLKSTRSYISGVIGFMLLEDGR